MLSRIEDILAATLTGKSYDKVPLSRVEVLLIALNQAILDGGGGSGGVTFKVVAELPTGDDISTSTIYFVKNDDEDIEEDNLYVEYAYINGSWEIIGSTTLNNPEEDEELMIKPRIVDKLPTEDIKDDVMYFVPNGTDEQGIDKYTEYIYVNGRWEQIGGETEISNDFIDNLFS